MTMTMTFKNNLLSQTLTKQEEILETMMKKASNDPDESAFFTWIQQLYIARVGTISDTDFGRDPLWSDMHEHHDSHLFQNLVHTLL